MEASQTNKKLSREKKKTFSSRQSRSRLSSASPFFFFPPKCIRRRRSWKPRWCNRCVVALVTMCLGVVEQAMCVGEKIRHSMRAEENHDARARRDCTRSRGCSPHSLSFSPWSWMLLLAPRKKKKTTTKIWCHHPTQSTRQRCRLTAADSTDSMSVPDI